MDVYVIKARPRGLGVGVGDGCHWADEMLDL